MDGETGVNQAAPEFSGCLMASAQATASALLKQATAHEAEQDLHEAIAKLEQVCARGLLSHGSLKRNSRDF